MKKTILTLLSIIVFLFICACSSSAPTTSRKDGKKETATGEISKYDKDESSEPEESSLDEKPEVRKKSSKKAERSASGRVSKPSSSGLRAGFSDDNKQFSYFLGFLKKYVNIDHFPLNVQERIVFQLLDQNDKSIANAEIEIMAGRKTLCKGKSLADGKFYFYPSLYDDNYTDYLLKIESFKISFQKQIQRNGKRNLEIKLEEPRRIEDPLAVDILFIMDTTGSMGEEIKRLKTTIGIIYENLAVMTIKPKVRFGMVLYKDKGNDEEYRTRIIPLTADLDEFEDALMEIEAAGGGDTPEDLQEALIRGLQDISWNQNGIRMAFIITDAPPQLHYQEHRGADYSDSVRKAKQMGIRIHSVGTGGLNLQGEYVLRQISQFTAGRYIFLTYGEEPGDSEGGSSGAVSHHTGANYSTDRLESIIIRFAKEDIAWQSDKALEDGDEYFLVDEVADEKRQKTLESLFSKALQQLSDYSSMSIDQLPTAITALNSIDEKNAALAEELSQSLISTAVNQQIFKIVERENLDKLLQEQEIQLSDIVDQETAVEVGKISGAKLFISGKIIEKDDYFNLWLRLYRVETGEVLAVTRAKIDKRLGL